MRQHHFPVRIGMPALGLLASLVAAPAMAATFDFEYRFADASYPVVHGSFRGRLDGEEVLGISNLTLGVDWGTSRLTEQRADLYGWGPGWNLYNDSTVSFDRESNRFAIMAGCSVIRDPSEGAPEQCGFGFWLMPQGNGLPQALVFLEADERSTMWSEVPGESAWQMTMRETPLPGTIGLLGLGLAALGFSRRRSAGA